MLRPTEAWLRKGLSTDFRHIQGITSFPLDGSPEPFRTAGLQSPVPDAFPKPVGTAGSLLYERWGSNVGWYRSLTYETG